MWLATKYGFYSIVKDERQNIFKIRARRKKDLLNLFPENEIYESDHTDYRFRVIKDQNGLNEFFYKINDIDYGNFKGHIAESPDQSDKLKAYGQIWKAMYDYQEKQQ
ncbi:MAG: hypothetical protein ACK4GL_06525 [Flavobacteriales bacterium]